MAASALGTAAGGEKLASRRQSSYLVESRCEGQSTSAPGLRPVLLAISIVMALMADTRFAHAAPGGAEQVASLLATAYEIDPGPSP
jgi:hypothetical protein